MINSENVIATNLMKITAGEIVLTTETELHGFNMMSKYYTKCTSYTHKGQA